MDTSSEMTRTYGKINTRISKNADAIRRKEPTRSKKNAESLKPSQAL
jgi:hypothetical protein